VSAGERRQVARSRLPGRGTLVALLLAGLGAPLVALAIPATVRIPRAKDHRPFPPAARAVFSHRAHEPLRCFQCHPGLFPQARLAFTHAAMDEGRFCGGCHDGRRASAVAAFTCETCHVPAR
jgi:c(7)-type cytochrome triheme protein